jgi:hypothetical protein
MLRYVVGFVVGGIAAWWFVGKFSVAASGQAPHAAGSRRSVLRGKIVPGPVVGSPAPLGLVPTGGYASSDSYEWAYVLGEGDSAGEVSRAITGDDGRYQELLIANPEVKTTGEPGVYLGPNALEPADGEFYAGRPLLLPVPWSRFVDEIGTARGGTTPFPPDPRGATSVSGVREMNYEPPARRLPSNIIDVSEAA